MDELLSKRNFGFLVHDVARLMRVAYDRRTREGRTRRRPRSEVTAATATSPNCALACSPSASCR
jgi:hypothetical protein